MAATHGQCRLVAKYIPHGLDAFCDVEEFFRVCMLINQVAENPDDNVSKAVEDVLGKM